MNILVKIVEDYIENDQTDYAILVNGEWGSGKTYYIKDKIIPIINIKNKCIYVSLNGISNINQIERDILVSYIGLKEQNKYISYLSSKISHISSFLSGVFTNNNFKIDFTSINIISLFNFNNVVILFDDLERISSKINLDEILGFINTSFVEHKSVKVILIGNLKEIREGEELKKIKEKLIGRQILFEYNFEEIYGLILNKYESNLTFSSFLKHHKDLFISFLVEYNLTNLRTLFFYFTQIENFYKTKGDIKDELWKRIFLFGIIITVEFKSGSFIENEKDKRKALWELTNNFVLIDLIRKNENEELKNESFSEIIVRTYLTNHRYDYEYNHSIYKSIVLGVFDKKLFIKEIDSSPEMKFSIALNQLNDYLILSKEDFNKNVELVFEALEKGIYSIYAHQNIFQILNDYSINGLINFSTDEVKEKILASLQIAKLREKDYDDELFDRGDYYVAPDADSKQIFSLITELHDKHFINQKREFVLGILSQITAQYSDFTKYFRSLHLVNLSDFISLEDLKIKIEQATNYNLTKFARLLAEKYRYDSYETIKDIPLIDSLIDYINSAQDHIGIDPLRKNILNNFIRILNAIKEKFSKKAK